MFVRNIVLIVYCLVRYLNINCIWSGWYFKQNLMSFKYTQGIVIIFISLCSSDYMLWLSTTHTTRYNTFCVQWTCVSLLNRKQIMITHKSKWTRTRIYDWIDNDVLLWFVLRIIDEMNVYDYRKHYQCSIELRNSYIHHALSRIIMP